MIIEAVIGDTKEPNANGRIYPKSVWLNIIKQTKDHHFLGRFQPDAENIHIVYLSQVSHVVREIRIDETKVVAVMEVIQTPEGKRLSSAIKTLGEGEIKFAPNGLGTITGNKVDDNFKLLAIDAIILPPINHKFPGVK